MRKLIFILSGLFVAASLASAQSKPRLVITADPELDDLNTLIRAILYTPDFQLEGLVYASSGVHWKGYHPIHAGTRIHPHGSVSLHLLAMAGR